MKSKIYTTIFFLSLCSLIFAQNQNVDFSKWNDLSQNDQLILDTTTPDQAYLLPSINKSELKQQLDSTFSYGVDNATDSEFRLRKNLFTYNDLTQVTSKTECSFISENIMDRRDRTEWKYNENGQILEICSSFSGIDQEWKIEAKETFSYNPDYQIKEYQEFSINDGVLNLNKKNTYSYNVEGQLHEIKDFEYIQIDGNLEEKLKYSRAFSYTDTSTIVKHYSENPTNLYITNTYDLNNQLIKSYNTSEKHIYERFPDSRIKTISKYENIYDSRIEWLLITQQTFAYNEKNALQEYKFYGLTTELTVSLIWIRNYNYNENDSLTSFRTTTADGNFLYENLLINYNENNQRTSYNLKTINDEFTSYGHLNISYGYDADRLSFQLSDYFKSDLTRENEHRYTKIQNIYDDNGIFQEAHESIKNNGDDAFIGTAKKDFEFNLDFTNNALVHPWSKEDLEAEFRYQILGYSRYSIKENENSEITYQQTGREEFFYSEASFNPANTNEISSNTFTLYPNPAKTSISLEFEGESAQLMIYDLQGRLQMQKQIQQDQAIDIQHLNKGLYICKLVNQYGSFNQKLVISNL